MAEFARFGALKDLTRRYRHRRLQAQTVPTFIDLGTVDDQLVGVFIKATLKGLIWYNPKVFTRRRPDHLAGPADRGRPIAAAEARDWCIGLESAATTGWPGTDWVEDMLLRESGPDVYDDWVAGRLTVDFARDQERLRVLRRGGQQRIWRSGTASSARSSKTAATACSPTRRSASSITRRRS